MFNDIPPFDPPIPMPSTVDEARHMLADEFAFQFETPQTWAQINARAEQYHAHLYSLGVIR